MKIIIKMKMKIKNQRIFPLLATHFLFFNFLFLLCPFNSLWAFTFNNSVEAVFAYNPSVQIVNTDCDHINFSHEELLTFATRAVDEYWNRVPTSKLRIARGGVVDLNNNAFKTETLCQLNVDSPYCLPNPNLMPAAHIVIACNNNPNEFGVSSAILASTLPFIEKRAIQSAVILLNDTATTPLNDLTEAEWVALLAHEIGHALGLGHSPVKDSLMFFSMIPKRVSLGRDDIDGVSYLYPKEDLFVDVNSCGSISLIPPSRSGQNHQDSTNHQRPGSPSSSFFLSFFLGILLTIFLGKEKKYLKYSRF